MVDKPSMPPDRAKTVHNNMNYTIASSNDDADQHRGGRNLADVPAYHNQSGKPSILTSTTTPNPPLNLPLRAPKLPPDQAR